MKNMIIILMIFIIAQPSYAAAFDYSIAHNYKYIWHSHSESSYQHAYKEKYGGVEEYILPDKTRADLLTDEHAIEFDFADKKYEAVGQALYYAVITGKKPKIVLIIDGKYKQRQMVYFKRLEKIGKAYNIDVEYISDEILTMDKNRRCKYKDCKCHRRKNAGLRVITEQK